MSNSARNATNSSAPVLDMTLDGQFRDPPMFSSTGESGKWLVMAIAGGLVLGGMGVVIALLWALAALLPGLLLVGGLVVAMRIVRGARRF